MITFQLPEDQVSFLISKLDQVSGTRQICNFFEGGLIQAQKQKKLEPAPDHSSVEETNKAQEKSCESQETPNKEIESKEE